MAMTTPERNATLVSNWARVCGWTLREAAALFVLKGMLTMEEAEEAVRWRD